jgi:hypothetical protein
LSDSERLIFGAHGRREPYHSPWIEEFDSTRALKTLEPFNCSSSSYFPFPPRRTCPRRSVIFSEKGWQSERVSICVTTLGCMEEDTEVWGDGRKLGGCSPSQTYAGERIIFWRATLLCLHDQGAVALRNLQRHGLPYRWVNSRRQVSGVEVAEGRKSMAERPIPRRPKMDCRGLWASSMEPTVSLFTPTVDTPFR